MKMAELSRETTPEDSTTNVPLTLTVEETKVRFASLGTVAVEAPMT